MILGQILIQVLNIFETSACKEVVTGISGCINYLLFSDTRRFLDGRSVNLFDSLIT
jgi:hypothetical protein